MNNKKRIEDCAVYIEEHIKEDLSTEALAEAFNYSPSHFKRRFREYYKMSVADYVRKIRFQKIAQDIQGGMNCKTVATQYGFRTYAGFARAFQKEFPVSPSVYSQGVFERIREWNYVKRGKRTFQMSILKMQPIQITGKTIITGKEKADHRAQINYWKKHGYPCGECVRLSCNIDQREDKIAVWISNEENGTRDYVLGRVVDKAEENSLEGEYAITLAGGDYAIFQTEELFDDETVAETLQLFVRAVLGGWTKENSAYVDGTRSVFDRFVNRKVYLYVPVK